MPAEPDGLPVIEPAAEGATNAPEQATSATMGDGFSIPAIPLPLGSGDCMPHSECKVGTALDATCSSCAAAVCAPNRDPGCCDPTRAWDIGCVWTARLLPECGACRPRPVELDTSLVTPLPGAGGDQDLARIAAGPSGQLMAVWEDSRNGTPEIVGTRFSFDALGKLQMLDKGGLVVGSSAGEPQLRPWISFDGNRYVVAWTTGSSIKVAWVDPLATTEAAITGPFLAGSGLNFDIADLATTSTDAESFAVVLPYIRTEASSSLPEPDSFQGIQLGLTHSGQLTGPKSFALEKTSSEALPTVVYCEKAFRIALGVQSADSFSLSLFRFKPKDTSPSPVPSAPMFGVGKLTAIKLGCGVDGSTLALFTAVRLDTGTCADTPTNIIQQWDPSSPGLPRVSESFTGEARRLDLALLLGTDEVTWRETACDTRTWLSSWNSKHEYDSMQALSRHDVSLARVKDKGIVAVGTHSSPTSAGTEHDIQVSRTPKIEDSWITLSTAPNQQGQVALAATNGSITAAWTEFGATTSNSTVKVRRLDSTGLPSNEDVKVLSLTDKSATHPAVAARAKDWLVAWSERPNSGNQVLKFVASSNDALQPPESVAVSDVSLEYPSLTPTASGYGFSFLGGTNACSNSECTFLPSLIGIGRVALQATSIDISHKVFLANDPRNLRLTTVAEDRVLLVWESNGNIFASNRDLSDFNSLTDLDPTPWVTSPGRQSQPDLVMRNEDEGLLVWRDEVDEGKRVRARRVTRIQVPSSNVDTFLPDGPTLLVSGQLAASQPRVALANDHAYVVAMEGSSVGAPTQVYATHVSFDGEVLDPEPVRISTTEAETSPPDATQLLLGSALARAPTVVRAPGGSVVFGYEQLLPSLGVPRVVTLTPNRKNSQGWSCFEDDQCSTGHCVDSICCESACDGECASCGLVSPQTQAYDGVCRPVTNADDDVPPGSDPKNECRGARSCNANGECRAAAGEGCRWDGDCATGHCFAAPSSAETSPSESIPYDGTCCDVACDGTCDSCVSTPGTCIATPCGAYSCVVANPTTGEKACIASCEDTSECAAGFQCVSGACVTPPSDAPTFVSCSVHALESPRTCEAIPLALGFASLALGLKRRRRSRAETRA